MPRRYRVLAKAHAAMARALEIRRRIARLLIRGRAQGSEDIMADLDALLSTMGASLELKETVELEASHTGNRAYSKLVDASHRIDTSIAEVVEHFEQAHAALVEMAGVELRLAAQPVREQLAARREDLEASLEGVKAATEFLDS